MLLTIRDVSDDLVEQAKKLTGKGTGSQAFIAGVEMAIALRSRTDHQREEISRLNEQIRVYQQTIARARDAAIEFAELAAQGDLFQPKETAPSRLRHHL